jgi:hypothetical protein
VTGAMSTPPDRQTPIAVHGESASIRAGVAAMVADIAAGLVGGAELVESHLEAYAELIPHVFATEVSHFLLELPAAAQDDAMRAIASAFERALARAGGADADGDWVRYLENLLFVSWFEEIEVVPAVLEAFVRVSGPLVQAQHRAYVRDTELYWKIHGDRTMTPERAARLVLAHDADAPDDVPARDEDRLN